MIKKENLQELLHSLGYIKHDDNIYYKVFNNDTIKVDLINENFMYPEDLKVWDGTTSNFSNPENFVVFECVNRLLSKGYLAKNIELEPRWNIGHTLSGGKADILVKDNNGDEYLIIECKTHRKEYEKAWNMTKTDGDQLFSYAQQIQKTQYLCLYTSNIEDGKLFYFNKIIALKDNEDYLKTLKPSQRKRYDKAKSAKELYEVWKDVYDFEFEESGIFEDGISTYEINKKYTLDDLKVISFEDSQKKYNEFATILRQHNVSSHENAFDKLVNILLAKIVDEIKHPDCLEFNWKGMAYDDYYQLQDRLQKLYKEGMRKFLSEEVTYVDNQQLLDAFKFFKNDPDATRNTVMAYFRELKFYTNNDFAFIDVHNEKLFKQNSEILVKIVKMFRDVKLKTDEQNQFLGDLFEGFLDDGIKQSEGQFFTPLPITRFIISSLPLNYIIDNLDEPPRVIDYSCGAGHFLNEYATRIRGITKKEQLSNHYSNVFGIEKEYRLSKVSKVSAFMYGQDEINIIYGDALANNNNIVDNSFDILIANPPYSVKGFLETLDKEDREKFELYSLIDKNSLSKNGSIETFFVERAKQLLKDGGVAGIILPNQILKKDYAIFTKTREIIISNFDIISIVELPSGTFRATNAETVVLFLRKKKNNPSLLEHYKNRVNSWFDCNFDKDLIFEDDNLLDEYLNKQNIDFDDYMEFLNGNINDNLKENDIFRQYINNNFDMKTIINLEKDKLLYFMLLKTQNNKIIIVNAPPKNKKKEIKKFLGYEWSERKGSEGIKYLGFNPKDKSFSKNIGITNIKTPLFNSNDLNDENKINTFIKTNFVNDIVRDKEGVHYIDSCDLINFDGNTFNKSFNLNIRNVKQIKSKYPLRFVHEILINTNNIKNIGNKVPNDEVSSEGEIPIVSQNKSKFIDGYTNNYEPITNLPLIVFGDHSCCFKYIDFEFVRGADGTQILLTDENEVRLEYLYYISSILKIENSEKYERHFKYLKNTKIPVPPISVQDNIIKRCSEQETEIKKIKTEIEEYSKNIEDLYLQGEKFSNNSIKLNDSNAFKLSIGNRVLTSELVEDGSINVISANVKESFGKIDKEIVKDYSQQYILWGIDGDWMIRTTNINEKFYPTDHCGYIEVLDNNINPKYLAKMIEKEGITLRFSRTNRASIDRVSNIEISLPNIDVQDNIVNKVIELENKIFELENNLDKLNEEKKNIIINILKIEYIDD